MFNNWNTYDNNFEVRKQHNSLPQTSCASLKANPRSEQTNGVKRHCNIINC